MSSIRLGDAPEAFDWDDMAVHAEEASTFLKAISHPSRLMILCFLSRGERSVTELEEMLELRQPTVSQQLARLRLDGLVGTRRQGKTVYYSLTSDRARRTIDVLYELFCAPEAESR